MSDHNHQPAAKATTVADPENDDCSHAGHVMPPNTSATVTKTEHHMAEPEMHTGHKQHGGMAHDMSDPAMAASMERDIRTRFLVALLLTIPTVLYSPIGTDLLSVNLPTPIAANWIMLLLSTPVIFWSGWMFFSGAVTALRSKTLDMSVLIATGVGAAYAASIVLMVDGNDDVFFDAAAMLVTFVLFGHSCPTSLTSARSRSRRRTSSRTKKSPGSKAAT